MKSPRIFYIHDPMCSWCYAFSQSWTALQRDLPGNIEVVCLVGGLAPDTMQPMSLETQQMVQQAWRRIEQSVPGVHFNWEFWSRNTPIRSTYPACRAVLAAKKQHVDAEGEMIKAIQAAYYRQAKNPSLPKTLQACAQTIGLDEAIFSRDLVSVETQLQLQQDIQSARQMDVYSYPSLRLEYKGKVFPIAVDYREYRSMLDAISRIVG